ncbi:hypothetical protein GGR54DRAFT_623220 [Hypoxylon sp. NC1633]|nr:hypothetical protein GGR54DRAFT_623220 [Hypoxylon sp. NC1633]
MAEPVGVIGTAVGVASLCLQVYGSLKGYLDDFRDRDAYVSKVLLYLDHLRDATSIIESAIPTLQQGHYKPSQTVMLCLQDCEVELNALKNELQKYSVASGAGLKQKLKETKKKIQFPFARPELEKLSQHLERVNNLLSVALQGLNINVLSANQDKLTDIGNLAHAASHDLVTINSKVNEIHSDGADIKADTKGSLAVITTVSQDVQELTLVTNEVRSIVPQINQIQDDTTSSVSLLQDLTARHHTQEQNNSRIEQGILELKHLIIQNNRNSPGETILQMVMSKPDFLRSCQETMATNGPSSSSRLVERTQGSRPAALKTTRKKYRTMSCGCRYRRRITREATSWFDFTRFDEQLIGSYHEPECSRYCESQETQKRTTGITYTGLRRLLGIAVSLSLVSRRGAGGFSISPGFRYYAMVDPDCSPAFRIVCTIGEAVRSIYGKCSRQDRIIDVRSDSYCELIIRLGISKLQRIFASQSSRPTDVDEGGSTMIALCLDHIAVYTSVHIEKLPLSAIHSILHGLLELGVPTLTDSSRTTRSRGILDCALGIPRSPNDPKIEQLSNDISLTITQTLPEDFIFETSLAVLRPTFMKNLFERHSIIAGVFGLDSPLFTALMRKDEDLLESALATFPLSPTSFVSNGLSAVHIAVFWPKGLKRLLEFHPNVDLPAESRDDITPLWLALNMSSQICQDHNGLSYENCPCTESIKLLLDYGCHLKESVLRGFRMSEHAMRMLLGHIKLWRRQLAQIAQVELLEAERHQLGVDNSSVLDHAAPEVIRRLNARGVFPFSETTLDLEDYRFSPPSHRSESSSIYHVIRTMPMAAIAFELGFGDTDVFYEGTTPIMKDSLPLQYHEWFLDHGARSTHLVPWPIHASPEQTLPTTLPQWTVAHSHMRGLVYFWGTRWWKDSAIHLFDRFMCLDIGDRCECSCSDPEGCSPLTVFLKHLSTAQIFEFVEFLETKEATTSRIADTVIRVLTFVALEIRHTCCETIYSGEIDSYGDDFPYIREEDEELLDELEDLVAEFKDQYHSVEQPLSCFLEVHWKERIDQISREKASRSMTREEIEAANDLGIMLYDYEESVVSQDSTSEGSSIEDTLEYWIGELDSI